MFSWTRVPGCEPDNVKVIIVGQDPIADDAATGRYESLAFAPRFLFILAIHTSLHCTIIHSHG